jgi:hypothetical protein
MAFAWWFLLSLVPWELQTVVKRRGWITPGLRVGFLRIHSGTIAAYCHEDYRTLSHYEGTFDVYNDSLKSPLTRAQNIMADGKGK